MYGCSDKSTVFQLLPADQTGIDFANRITTTDSINALYFEYIYNGGGIAAGDVNNDGLLDLYFTGNQVSSKLYVNKGDLQFEDITLPSGVNTERWCTGVAMADVNDDGRLDIYVSVAGYNLAEKQMENLLFINQGWDEDGIPSFRESGEAYGLNDPGYSTQAAFFDYDRDGDLDVYLLTNALEKFNRNNLEPKRRKGEARSTDRLYRNNGDETFTNVSAEAGILIEGYGLGINVVDLNFDGWPDVYAANDFLSNDLIWMNQGDGTFVNKAGEYLKHQTHNGMGVDIADFNNDGLPDITVLDMLPEDNFRQKMMIPKVNYDKFQMKRDLGYEDQYMRNTVQLNQGFTADGAPRFSEIGNLLGMAATDWSWSVLYADFDNDGWKDAYITNGYRKDVTNLDFINYSNYNQMFGSVEAKRDKAISDLEDIAEVEVSNYLFHNRGGLRFENATREWGLARASFSNGAVYADLDNDGDLDLVTNNIDAEAFVFENRITAIQQDQHFLQIALQEDRPDLTVHNAKVMVYSGGKMQYQEYSPYRGYKSTVGPVLHFGMGSASRVDSVLVFWLNGQTTKAVNVPADQRLTLAYAEASSHSLPQPLAGHGGLEFRLETEPRGLQFLHRDNYHTDLKTTRTLPHDFSKTGPALAAGDINGDGLQDVFIGGNRNQSGRIFVQGPAGGFSSRVFPFDSTLQDVDALFLDADSDGDQDLYVVSGGTFSVAQDTFYRDRLYRNDGRGNFVPDRGALPAITASGSCVRAADYDRDGDLDLFVGGRIVPGRYPVAPRSYLLKNEGGTFIDATPAALREIGLVTDAVWTDVELDQQADLMIVGEWMPVTLFKNQAGQLLPAPIDIDGKANKTNGWWMHINAADIDQDGDQDYLVGNLGLNSKLRASASEPVTLYAKDFDENGAIDPLLSCYIQGREYLMHERDLVIDQIPGMKRRFPDYRKYAEAEMDYTLSPPDLEGAEIKETYQFASVILENRGDHEFVVHRMPLESQLSPIMGSQIVDLNADGRPDILTAGNFHASETNQLGWYDASYGNILLQTSPFQFEVVPPLSANLQLDGDVRVVRRLPLPNGQDLFLFGIYGGALKAYSINRGQTPELTLNTR